MADHPMDEFRKWSDPKRKNDEFYIIDDSSGFDESPSFDEYTIGDYFQRMALRRTEKTVRVETAKAIKKKVDEFFLFQWDELRKGWFLTLTPSDDYRNMLFDLYMTFSTLKDDYMRDLARRWANEVEDYTEKVITASPDYPKFQRVYWEQVLKGRNPAQIRNQPSYGGQEEITKAATSPDILNVLSTERAQNIALTETNVIHNYSRHLDLVADGQITHTWLTMEDEKVRPYHAAADLQTKPIDEPFEVDGELLMFPGDTSLGATAKNICFCRCIEG